MTIQDFKTNKYGKKALAELFVAMVNESGCVCSEPDYSNDFFVRFTIEDLNKKTYGVSVFFRNISNSGWADKPEIKRIQVPKLPNIRANTKNDFTILVGVTFIDGETTIAVWDPLKYMTHNTVCSCYVFFSSFLRANSAGFFHGINEGKEVMVCNKDGFETLLHELSSRYL